MSADDICETRAIDDYLERRAIIDVALHIAKAADGRDEDALRSYFLPDAVMVIDRIGTFEGVNAIVGSLGVLRALDLTQHVIAHPSSNSRGSGDYAKLFHRDARQPGSSRRAAIHCRRPLRG